MEQTYFDERQAKFGYGAVRGYPIFDQYPITLEEYRKRRLGLTGHFVSGQLLKERASHQAMRFDELVETDFILFLRCALKTKEQNYGADYWQARTAGYAEYRGVFPVFAKATAKKVFDQLRIVLGVQNKEDLQQRFEAARDSGQFRRDRGFSYLSVERLINLENLGTSK